MPVKYFYIFNKAEKEIEKLPIFIQNKIDKAFDRIRQNPLIGIKLHGELSDYIKYRVGDYRIIYRFEADLSQIIVLKVEHRQGVYK